MKLCSACLLGIKCRYDGKTNLDRKVMAIAKKEILIPVCPEQLGGLSTPRIGSGILGGEGAAVINRKAKVLNRRKKDVTANFIRGAKEALRIARVFGIKEVIFKQGSPSCGCGLSFQWKISKNRWTNRKRKGDGVAAALLKRNGIKVISEKDL